MKLRLLYHGHCFDGVASAATFTRFYKERIHPEAEVNYTGLLHRPGNLFDHSMFDSDENAIVDFKYAASEKLTWWFDHHESAFLTPEDEAHFRADKSGKKFLDATRKSCTEFIADVAHERFGFNAEPIESLVHWAHVIDGALYESPAQCVELKEPALQLMQVIESDPDDAFIEQIIRDLTVHSLEEVATSAEVQRRFRPILQQHLALNPGMRPSLPPGVSPTALAILDDRSALAAIGGSTRAGVSVESSWFTCAISAPTAALQLFGK